MDLQDLQKLGKREQLESPVDSSKKYRWWLITKPMTKEAHLSWEDIVKAAEPLHPDYATGQIEKCPTTGTLHWHLVLHSKGQQRVSALHKAFPKGDIKTITIGTEQRVIDYVTKPETREEGPFTFGVCPVKRNSATDWALVKEHAKAGNLDMIPPEIFVRNFGNLERISKAYLSLRAYNHHRVRGVWIHGESGLGKSHFVNVTLEAKFGSKYDKLVNKWFDGYLQQPLIALHDIDTDHVHQLHHLKIWADKWSFIGEAKGGALIPRHQIFVVTSNHSIDEIFSVRSNDKNPNEKKISAADVKAIKRRFMEFEAFGKEAEAVLGTNKFVDLSNDREYSGPALADFLHQTFASPPPKTESQSPAEILEPKVAPFAQLAEFERMLEPEWLPIEN